MVRIEAIIRPSRLDEVKSALDDMGVQGIRVTEIKGAGKQKGYTQHYRGSEYQVNLLPKVQLIVVVPTASRKASSARLKARPAPAKSATARSSSRRFWKRFASAPASAATSRVS